MKQSISMLVSLVMILVMLCGVIVIPISAANPTTLTLSDTAGELGEIVDIWISISENSYLVNGDLNLTYDASYLRYIPDSCKASALLESAYWSVNNPVDGSVRISFATGASSGLSEKGNLFTMQFEIISKDTTETSLSLNASPLRGCNGGDDFDVKSTVTGGKIGIVGGADPWNFLQAAFLENGQENVSIDEDGVWTVTGDFTLSPDFTFDYTNWGYIAQKFTTNTPVKIMLIDRDPLGGYEEHTIGLYDNFVGPQFYPADSYNQVNSIRDIYSWNIKNNGWKNSGLATIDQVIVHFETSENVSATFTSLYMTQNQVTTSSVVRTTATKPTTITTKVQEMSLVVETITNTEPIVTGDTFTLDITAGEIDAIRMLTVSITWDEEYLENVGGSFYKIFEDEQITSVSNTITLSYTTEEYMLLEADTVIATLIFRAKQDIAANQDIVIENATGYVKDIGTTELNVVNGGIRIVNVYEGDVTGDGVVNLNDATALFYHVNGLSTLNENVFVNADMNGDGQVNLADATALFYKVNGLV